ncbi:MAG: tetratricopeptide repeat protein, partial [Ruminiclostridium sp.]|nr:tetratricopeptide repeat protein [Ruminiclostridium sp.]
EISDIDILFELFRKLYSDADKHHDTVINIIEAVNRHTLSVELAARLLEKGLLAPDDVLEKLNECSVDPETSDRINVKKDGKSVKATFYEHIRALFKLFKLSEDYQFILRCLTFVRVIGIDPRLFAHFLSLSDMNDINDLEELGLIKVESSRISLQPIVKDIAIADLVPSVNNCRKMLTNLQNICLRHGVDIPYYQTLFLYIEDVVTDIKNDDHDFYITFIEDAFSYMEKYQYENGMRRILSVMKAYKTELKPNDLALYYDFESAIAGMFDKDFKKAISFSQTALDTCVPGDDLHLAANLNMNLGYNYHLVGQLEPACEYMERAIKLMSEYGKPNNDMLIIYHNYANLMDDCGEPMKAIRAMKKCAEFIKGANGESADYADFRLSMGKMYLKIGNVQNAKENFSAAFNIYASLFGADSEMFESKFAELVEFADTHGIPINKNLITE